MNTQTDKLISLTYEIEGLLLLLRDRGQESIAPHIRNLLAAKGQALANMLCDMVAVPAAVAEAPAVAEEKAPAVVEQVKQSDPLPPIPPVVETEVEAKVDESENSTSPSISSELHPTVEPVVEKNEEHAASLTKLDEAQAEEDEADSAAAEEEVAREKHTAEIKSSDEAGKKIMKLFSFNDTFRFRRELFGGSDTAMKAILAIIGTMPTFDEAKRYLIEDQGMDPESEEVSYFFEIIAPYYGK